MKRAWWLLAMIPLGLAAALFLHLSLSQQKLQMYTDSAAMAAAEAVHERRDPTREIYDYLGRASARPLSRPPEVEAPPRDGRYAGNAKAVRVRLQSTWRPPLAPGLLAVELQTQATGAVWEHGPGRAQVAFVRIE